MKGSIECQVLKSIQGERKKRESHKDDDLINSKKKREKKNIFSIKFERKEIKGYKEYEGYIFSKSKLLKKKQKVKDIKVIHFLKANC